MCLSVSVCVCMCVYVCVSKCVVLLSKLTHAAPAQMSAVDLSRCQLLISTQVVENNGGNGRRVFLFGLPQDLCRQQHRVSHAEGGERGGAGRDPQARAKRPYTLPPPPLPPPASRAPSSQAASRLATLNLGAPGLGLGRRDPWPWRHTVRSHKVTHTGGTWGEQDGGEGG